MNKTEYVDEMKFHEISIFDFREAKVRSWFGSEIANKKLDMDLGAPGQEEEE